MFRVTFEPFGSKMMIVSRFDSNIEHNLQDILSYCVNNEIISYVDFDKGEKYTVKIDVTPLMEKKAIDLINHINELKKR